MSKNVYIIYQELNSHQAVFWENQVWWFQMFCGEITHFIVTRSKHMSPFRGALVKEFFFNSWILDKLLNVYCHHLIDFFICESFLAKIWMLQSQKFIIWSHIIRVWIIVSLFGICDTFSDAHCILVSRKYISMLLCLKFLITKEHWLCSLLLLFFFFVAENVTLMLN